jgi:hypothetical protein
MALAPLRLRENRSSVKYTTGVVNKVSICDSSKPPTMAMPSGRRISEPVP